MASLSQVRPLKRPKLDIHRVHEQRRLASLALAALCVLGQLSGIFHLALVQHVVCPQHGDLVHADELHTEVAAVQSPQLAGLRSVSGVRGGETGVGSHQHDHCLLYAHRREPAFFRTARGSFFAAARSVQFDSWPGLVSRATSSLFRIAPKQSPPV